MTHRSGSMSQHEDARFMLRGHASIQVVPPAVNGKTPSASRPATWHMVHTRTSAFPKLSNAPTVHLGARVCLHSYHPPPAQGDTEMPPCCPDS